MALPWRTLSTGGSTLILAPSQLWKGCLSLLHLGCFCFCFFPQFLFLSIYLFLINLFILLYNIVLVLPYIDLNLPWVYMCSPSWTPLTPPSLWPSGSSQCTSPKHPVSCIKPGLAIRFTYDILHVSVPFSHIILPLPSLLHFNWCDAEFIPQGLQWALFILRHFLCCRKERNVQKRAYGVVFLRLRQQNVYIVVGGVV